MAQNLAFERYTLENGMTVILHQDRSLPLVVVNLWYGVGSKDEGDGRSGFAHLFEHLMFMGTDRVPEGQFDAIMESLGGSNNASTSEDRTNYYSTGPSHMLPTLLWLEADRLEVLGRAMTQEKLDLQRDVVRNERRQSYENQPYGRTWLEMPGLVFPPDHPYGHSVIGSHEDLEAATVEDVKGFFDTYYVASNVSLCVAGDLEIEDVKKLILDLFGSLPKRPLPPRKKAAPPRLSGVVKKTLTDEVPAPRTLSAWLSPKHFGEGDAALDLIADILGGGPSSRLEQSLVREKRLAQDVSARQDSGELSSTFYVSGTALPGVAIEDVERAIEEEIQKFKKEGPTAAELERAKNKQEADVAREMQSLLHRADQLNMYQSTLGDPGRFEFDQGRYRSATAEELKLWAGRVLDLDRRVHLRVVPGVPGTPGLTSARDVQPMPRLETDWSPPIANSKPLGNAELWTLERRQTGLLALEISIPMGADEDPAGKAGRTSIFAELLKEGAGSRDALAYASELDRLGSSLKIATGRTVFSISASFLSRHAEATLDLIYDALENPLLTAADFERKRNLRIADLKQRDVEPTQIAALVGQRILREAEGRNGEPATGTVASIGALSHEDMKVVHATLKERIAHAKIAVVGDSSTDDMVARLERRFHFTSRKKAQLPSPAPRRDLGNRFLIGIVDRPSAPQTVIRFHRNAVPIGSEKTSALQLANVAFGGSFTSRLNQNLREEHGYTYGASSRIAQGATEGTFSAGSSVQTAVTGPALEEFLKEFDRLSCGDFDEEELAKALASERTDLIREFETVTDTASRLIDYAEAGLPPKLVADRFQKTKTQKVPDLNKVAAELMTKAPGVLVLVGDAKVIVPELERLQLGAFRRYDPEGRPLD